VVAAFEKASSMALGAVADGVVTTAQGGR